ncbi:MAG: hypothetical protein NT038_00175 [Euryarchaeota archaeon]|nr:hypothetical protein [Euryarchaeota archaeon]
MLAIVPATLAVVLMLVLAGGFVQVPTASVTKEKLAEESHCPACDYLEALYSGETWGFDGSLEEFNEMYGEDGGREIMLVALTDMAACPGSSNPLDQIISEYQATGSLDTFFAPLYSYVIPGSISGSSEISISQATSVQRSGRILFDATPVGGGGIGGTHITGEDGISQTVIKTHYTYEDLGITYAEIYQRALDMQDWLDGGSYPDWAGDPAWTNAQIDCWQMMMVGAGIAKCIILPIVLLAPLFFGLPLIVEILQVLGNNPELFEIGGTIWNFCVEALTALRLGFGLPP